MTSTYDATNTAEYNKGSFREFTTELVERIAGDTIKSAKVVNNLVYRKNDDSEVVKCGLWVETSKGTQFGLFRWDILQSHLDYSNPDKVVAVDLSGCLMNRAARAAFTTCGGDEEKWLTSVAKAIEGKTCSCIPYIGKNTKKGNLYNGVAFIVK